MHECSVNWAKKSAGDARAGGGSGRGRGELEEVGSSVGLGAVFGTPDRSKIAQGPCCPKGWIIRAGKVVERQGDYVVNLPKMTIMPPHSFGERAFQVSDKLRNSVAYQGRPSLTGLTALQTLPDRRPYSDIYREGWTGLIFFCLPLTNICGSAAPMFGVFPPAARAINGLFFFICR